jgi:hypothetical protein
MSEKETEPCQQCGAETDKEELDNNEELFDERICDNCAEILESEADLQDIEDE